VIHHPSITSTYDAPPVDETRKVKQVRVSRNIFEAVANGETETFEPVDPEEPTHAQPGSREKIQKIVERLHRGESAFHPEDASQHATLEEQVAMMQFCKSDYYHKRKRI